MCLAAGVTNDILMCPECGHYHDGYPDGYTRPRHKTCLKCGHRGLEDAHVATLLAKANRKVEGQ